MVQNSDSNNFDSVKQCSKVLAAQAVVDFNSLEIRVVVMEIYRKLILI